MHVHVMCCRYSVSTHVTYHTCVVLFPYHYRCVYTPTNICAYVDTHWGWKHVDSYHGAHVKATSDSCLSPCAKNLGVHNKIRWTSRQLVHCRFIPKGIDFCARDNNGSRELGMEYPLPQRLRTKIHQLGSRLQTDYKLSSYGTVQLGNNCLPHWTKRERDGLRRDFGSGMGPIGQDYGFDDFDLIEHLSLPKPCLNWHHMDVIPNFSSEDLRSLRSVYQFSGRGGYRIIWAHQPPARVVKCQNETWYPCANTLGLDCTSPSI